MRHVTRQLLTYLLAVGTSVTYAAEAPTKAPREVPAKVDPGFRPEAGVEYTLVATWLYRPDRASNPGPAGRDSGLVP